MAYRRGQSIELAASERVLNKLAAAVVKAPKKAQRLALRTLRRSLRTGKSQMSAEIRKTLNLPKKTVDQRIRTTVISTRSLVGRVTGRDRRIELVEFMTKSQIATAYRRQRARRGQGVSVKTRKDQGRQLYPDTFMELGRRDRKWHVLKRDGPERYPISIQYGPNLTKEFEPKLPAFAARQAEQMSAELERVFDRELGL